MTSKFEVIALTIILAALGLVIYCAYVIMHPPLVARTYAHDKTKYSPVVRITDGNGRTFCTGVVVSPSTVITAGHCVLVGSIFGMTMINDNMYVRDDGSKPPGISVKVKYLTMQLDQATIGGDFSEFEPKSVITDIGRLVEITSKSPEFVSCGYPLGGKLYCSKTQYIGRINFMWLVKGVLLPGMSGGPTMLDDGTVIAINDAVQDDFSIVSPVFNVPVE